MWRKKRKNIAGSCSKALHKVPEPEVRQTWLTFMPCNNTDNSSTLLGLFFFLRSDLFTYFQDTLCSLLSTLYSDMLSCFVQEGSYSPGWKPYSAEYNALMLWQKINLNMCVAPKVMLLLHFHGKYNRCKEHNNYLTEQIVSYETLFYIQHSPCH